MAKILISPLGVGDRFNEISQNEREYCSADYVFGGQNYPESRFIASVLYKHLQIGLCEECGNTDLTRLFSKVNRIRNAIIHAKY
ncbi:hypothetical protein [Trichothermofontia sp.]